jgi:hypothetical protein
VHGVTSAVVGVLAGTVPLIALTAVPDATAAVILAMGGVLMFRRSAPDPVIVGLGALAGVALS